MRWPWRRECWKARGRTHEDVAMLVGLDAIGEIRELRVSQDLGQRTRLNVV